MQEQPPLILTLRLDQHTFDYFNQLRQQYFPPERNVLSAHITLFHKLPGEQKQSIQHVLHTYCDRTSVLKLTMPTVRSLGSGVAINVDCPELVQLRQQLAKTWSEWLSRQDQQGYRPHITIQNKTTPAAAQHLYEQLTQNWQPQDGQGEGLLLWRYQQGPWELVDEFKFGSA